MELGSIIEVVATFLFGGGILTFVTLRDKKTEAMLNNMEKVIEELRALVNGYKQEVKDLKEELKEKERYIDDLHKKESGLYEKLDKANSKAAIFRIMKCTRIDCKDRKPPFGSGAVEVVKAVDKGTLSDDE